MRIWFIEKHFIFNFLRKIFFQLKEKRNTNLFRFAPVYVHVRAKRNRGCMQTCFSSRHSTSFIIYFHVYFYLTSLFILYFSLYFCFPLIAFSVDERVRTVKRVYPPPLIPIFVTNSSGSWVWLSWAKITSRLTQKVTG